MREILFRGFHEDSDGKCILVFNGCTIKGFWVTGCLVDIPCEDYDVCISPIITDEQGRTHSAPYWENKNVIPETISQFTGLCDKKAKQGFEHDVVKRGKSTGVIKFGDGRFFIDWGKNPESWSDTLYIHLKDSEVIGTIFDVKEEAK